MTNRDWTIRIVNAIVNFNEPDPPESIIERALPFVEAFGKDAYGRGWEAARKAFGTKGEQ